MLRQWIVCLICLWLPLVEMFGPMPAPDKMQHDAMEMKDKAEDAKKELDEEDVTEQQFYECFADVNCELGKAVRDELFDCWHINPEEELAEYVLLFKDSPGNFTKLNADDVNKHFCTMDDELQREVNDYFASQAGAMLKDICGNPKLRERCKRLKETSQCAMDLLETNIANGNCKTIVADMENMEPPKPPMGGM